MSNRSRGAADWIAPLAAGAVAVLVGFSSSAVIVYQAARAMGADDAVFASWMWALGIGCGLSSLLLSMRYRAPVLTAWSTPGAALLATSPVPSSLGAAIGAFMVVGVLISLAGFTGLFERLMRRVPLSIASALLAGVLVRFGLNLFDSAIRAPVLILSMLLAYVIGRRAWPGLAVLGVLLCGVTVAAVQGSLSLAGLSLRVAEPLFIAPRFDAAAWIGLGLPLFVVTMASQNIPGVAAMHSAGYRTPISAPIGWTGVATTVLAPFGAFTINLAAITAAICMGAQAHENPALRYRASMAAGGLYLLTGVFGASVAAVFGAFPGELVAALAGIALLGTIANSLAAALGPPQHREAALFTFLVSASGLTIAGVGAAFWGLVAGLAAMALLPSGRGD